MSTLLDHILEFFKIHQTKVQDDASNKQTVTRFWPRRLGYTAGRDFCSDEEEEEEEICEPMICDDEDKVSDEPCDSSGGGGDDGEEECPCEPSRVARKMRCLTRAAKYGMKEGALCGVFFGGGWGIYKWIDSKYLSGKEGGSDEGGGNDEEGESTTNSNVIFVTAANSAVAMGVICTFICCTKSIIYCG